MTTEPGGDPLERLRGELPPQLFRDAEPRYLEEPRGQYHGRASALLAPRSTDEVAAILRLASALRLPVVPYGGGTGLVGGQVAPDGPPPLLVSLERMTAIRAIYPQEAVLVAEAGAVLADVQAAAADHGMLFPLSMASQGSCRIGGNLATNSGGVGVLRYGNARDLCLGLEAVLPDGSVLHGLKRLRKDNTGYDLRNLLIGSEGTLGIITAASLRLVPRPASDSAAILAVPDPTAALRLLALARQRLGEGISAFELMHRQGMDFLAATMPQVRQPFDPAPDWSVLVDVGLHGDADAEAALTGLFEAAFEAGLVTDGVIASSGQQRDEFWTLRESHPRGEPTHRRHRLARRVAAARRAARFHRRSKRRHIRARPVPGQLLRPCRRRKPALQRVPARGRKPRRPCRPQGRGHARCA